MRTRLRRRPLAGRLGPAILAAALAIVAGFTPPATRVAVAAGPLQIDSEATYELDPEAGRVHVAIDFELTNLKPSSATTIFYYSSASFAIHPEAVNIRATDGAGALSTTTRERRFYTRVNVHLRSFLYFRESTRFTLRYDLVGGRPRSDSTIRASRAFATFGVWAWGDNGRSGVEVRVPDGYDVQLDGDTMREGEAGRWQTYTARPDRPARFYVILSAENPDAYDSDRISLDGGIELVIRGWPDDPRWADTVGDTLRDGLPELVELVGLPWPVNHDLEVRERFTPALEGYAGVFLALEEAIELSEDLDPLTTMHEASHAWFSNALFTERWIYEGLAEEYSWRVQEAVGGPSGFGPQEPDPDDPGRIPLDHWLFPEGILDEATENRELYGYTTSFWAVHTIVEAAGIETMQAAFEAAHANRTAYPGTASPEMVEAFDGWRRFLDLAQPVDVPESPAIDAVFRELVLDGPADLALLDERLEARAAYRELVEAGDGWQPPWYVRQAMGTWAFEDAERKIDEASDVLARRDEITETAEALGLTPDDALHSAYETATGSFERAETIAADQVEALAAIDDARSASDASVDLVAQIGLLGSASPSSAYDAARAAFERGELDVAIASATAGTGALAVATALGQQRLVIAAVAALGLLLLLGLLLVLRRRRRRGVAALASAAAVLGAPPVPAVSVSRPAAASEWPAVDLGPRPPAAPAEPAWWLPTRESEHGLDATGTSGATEPSGTLGADPAAPSSTPAANATELEGDSTRGEPPAN